MHLNLNANAVDGYKVDDNNGREYSDADAEETKIKPKTSNQKEQTNKIVQLNRYDGQVWQHKCDVCACHVS